MPDGSSSAAPVMRPGPRSAKKRWNERVSPGGVSIVTGGFIVSDGGSINPAMSGRMMARVDQGFKGGYMRRHVLASIAVVMAGGVLVVAQPAAPQSTSGQADLQGTWNFSTITPLERPAEFAGKEFLTRGGSGGI